MQSNLEVNPAKPGEESVFDRGLVTEKVTWKSIVKYRNAYSTSLAQHRNFSGDVLAYVTPWNNHGYDVAKTFGSKFTQISPVWLQLRYDSSSAFVISGRHDIDSGWIRDVRDTGAKMLPRVLFEGWTPQQIRDLSMSSGKLVTLGKVLTKFARENNFDGYVFELWSHYSYGGRLTDVLIAIIRGLYSSLQNDSLSLVLVIPPPLYDDIPGMFSRDHFDNLKDHVTSFSLMTYDYSNPQRPGPNAPLSWMRQCVEHLVPGSISEDQNVAKYRGKILLGLNFYGYDYTAQGASSAILGNHFAEMLQKFKPKISWSDQFAEHYVQIRGSEGHHMVFFPTLKSISSRIDLATKLGTGLSIWEIGQGMDYFYDLL
ncbi:chitinase domain-containing protein 1-like isoform X2 [Varroa jacobsoni]|uniref:chitinase domain-containing protein 1-like isoform X2 n=1 Tax=Varroa jacobsoni TaxID=62625 RepID=UPI000BF515DE|nr:chitinase domain-containing protein 1-like isoform X2 [Varroa jacobsoni]